MKVFFAFTLALLGTAAAPGRSQLWEGLYAPTLPALAHAPAAANLTAPAETPPPPVAKPRRRTVYNQIEASTTSLFDSFSFLTGTRHSSSLFSASLPATAASLPTSITLDTFDAGSATGSVITTSTWSGQVTQNSTSITIAGTARNDNGWGATGLTLNATGLGFINITAQRDPGHAGGHLFLQFEDRATSTNTAVFSVDSSLFALGSPTTLAIPLGNWGGSNFDYTQIGSWSIGGGGLGTADFRMTLHHVELSATAIPEPETYAALTGLTALALALHRHRRRPLIRP